MPQSQEMLWRNLTGKRRCAAIGRNHTTGSGEGKMKVVSKSGKCSNARETAGEREYEPHTGWEQGGERQ